MSCNRVFLPQNSVLAPSDITDLRAAATIYLTTPASGPGHRFKSGADYIKYRKASALAGSSMSNPKLPAQTTVITQLQAAGCQ